MKKIQSIILIWGKKTPKTKSDLRYDIFLERNTSLFIILNFSYEVQLKRSCVKWKVYSPSLKRNDILGITARKETLLQAAVCGTRTCSAILFCHVSGLA